ncbi:efflux RND transporter periplasmic adaptor subunit [Myxococcota bacterium]|nr:efflux RND transporter periplasmic adaptor subunit [Myxococcota bacterium]
MRSDTPGRGGIRWVILWAGLLGAGCGSEPPPTAEKPPSHRGASEKATGRETREKGAEQAQTERGDESDLDRPVEELFSATCEHGQRAFECDDCRHEVGVVRVPQPVLEEGLVRTVEAAPRAMGAPVMLTGEVRFDERRVTHLAPRTDGVIRAVHVQVGDRVRPGQVLVEVDSVALGEAQGEYLEAMAARDLASRTLRRQEALRQEGVSSEREVLEARNQFESADIRVRSASERLLRLGVDPSDLRALANASRLGSARGRLVVRAPSGGRVLDMHAVPGESARAGESMVVIGEIDPVRVFADLYEDRLGAVQDRVAAGPVAVTVSVKAYPGEGFPGTLDMVGSVMERETRTVKARVTVANPEGKLRPGMFAEVRLMLPGEERVLAVPRSAVMQDLGRSFVFVPYQGDFWVRRPVRTGREWEGWVEVQGGIETGQRVAADGAFLLKSDVLRTRMGAGCAD